ncbi:PAS domain S-box protein [Methanoculleus sp. FWC-SCC1]|uniref:PAS domain S-box protein n=1 Tax=Methanoculleus frigidifontis TaxID=2584085 RepID=A0ABT8M9W8_9EURY|nr:PAS domain S-box protein [Methanoculleus sp. FWC-SCC1]MDN7024730.1 PAS domain S-box protein [Methanoculleus sp. FWC-SCC1]
MGCSSLSAWRYLSDRWLIAVLVLSVVTLLITAYSLWHQITGIFPHLFYIPILLAIYRHPQRGFVLAVVLASLYAMMVYFFTYPDMLAITEGTIRFIVMVGISGIIAYLVGRLRDQEKKYHSIFGNSQAGIFLVDLRSLQITEVNRRCAEMLGYMSDELTGTAIKSVWRKNDELKQFLYLLEKENTIDNYEGTFTTRDGSMRYMVLSAGALSPSTAVCTVVDMTERREAELMLRGASEFGGILVRERDEHSLLRKACYRLGHIREGLIVSIWLGKSEKVSLFAISDEHYTIVAHHRPLRRLIESAYKTGSIVSRQAADAESRDRWPDSIGDVRAIPMIAGIEPVGVIAVARTDGGSFTAEETNLLATLANDLGSALKLSELEEEKREAYGQIDRNIEQFAILGDHIRNPLQVIVGLACLEENPASGKIIEQAYTIQGIVNRLDSGWIESAMIREFLRRHY